MFCSTCGQEQASESVHFCSRCGFKFSGIEEGLAKRVIMMAMYLAITIFAIIGWGSITSGPGYMQVRVIVTIIASITFYLLFSGDLTHIFSKLFSQQDEGNKQIAPAGQRAPLPPAHSIPVTSFGPHRVNTAEMVQPPSVTEETTVLLDRDKR
jgi:hypothetical protein